MTASRPDRESLALLYPESRVQALKTVAMVFGVILCLLGIWVAYSMAEARSFEKLTGKHVTTWDAMWLDLRVQEGVK